ncbi:hypothetical protein BJV77DRAFT_1086541 [Russula vinacea]|nr:hypothetical protein BJV77DRAFT_1086541 [Russula vinacea]
MGATFTPSMSWRNTVLIAAYISGRKATKARDWSIPVVNHTWLEDCFIRWKTLSVGLEKYVAFPPGLDFSNHLGERSIQREVILEGLLDLIAEIALSQGKITSVRKILDHHDGPQTPLSSQSSAPTSLPSLTITPASTTPPASPLSTLTSETSEEDVRFGRHATVNKTDTGRSAANKAIQRLREEVMPDVISFEKEMRPVRHSRKSSQGSAAEIPSSKRGGAGKGPEVKEGDSQPRSEKSVRILATQVTLDEGEEKALVKLGARVGVRPDECTHLVAETLARTEKLLCAMSVAPTVIIKRWVRDSIAAKKLLPTDKYTLADPVNEKKWKFNLVDALKRAKENKGQLFAGKIFYVTDGVQQNKLLGNVVSAHGGQVNWFPTSTKSRRTTLRRQNPTVHTLSSNKRSPSGHSYVISCPEDVAIWQPLVDAGQPVFSNELIYSAALTQEIRFNAEGVRIDTWW